MSFQNKSKMEDINTVKEKEVDVDTLEGLVQYEDSDNEEILVHGRLVSLKRMLPAKLSHYCQKFKIPYPKYQTCLVNETSPEKRFYWCLLEIEDKRAVGQSKMKKEAEMHAAGRMLDCN